MAEFAQPSFSSGEIAPAAYGRVDLAKYTTALKTCRNFLTRVLGGVVNRPGTEFIAESAPGRFIPFIFNENQSYVLDFLDSNLMFIYQGGYILEIAKTAFLDGVSPATFTVPAHGYINSDVIYVTNTRTSSLDNKFWPITNVTPNTFQLVGTMGTGSSGTVARRLKIASPYNLSSLPSLSFTQLRDVMTLALTTIQPKNLNRLAHDNWNFNNMEFTNGPFQDVNTDINVQVSISAISGFITIDSTAAIFSAQNVGQLFNIFQRDYGIPWEVGKSVNVDDLRRSEGKYYRAADSGTTGSLRPNGEVLNTFENDGAIRWEYLHSGQGEAQIVQYNGPQQVVANVISTHGNMPADLITIPSYKWAFGAWGGDQGWPAVVTYFQQRRTFFSSTAKPEFVWLSGTNAYTYYGESTPGQDDDAISMQLVGRQISAARFAFDLGKLIVFTSNGKWVIPDDDNNPVLTPTHRSARAQGGLGAANVLPALVEDSILYVVDKGQTVQDISYQFVSNAYSGKDLTVLSKHLFEKYHIVAAAYQHVPFQVDWLVRSDGILLGITYLKEHDVWGLHRHDFRNGFVEDVCVISEGQEDRVYLKIRRVINGVTKWYTERLTSRLFTDIRDAHFVDCGLKYDGRNTSSTAIAITSVSGGGFGEGGFGEGGFGVGGFSGIAQVTLVSSAPYFTANKIGDELHFPYQDRTIKIRVVGVTSDYVANGESSAPIPSDLVNVAIINWGLAKSTLDGFTHLEGEILSILADGKVHRQIQVMNNFIDLDYAAVVITAGLPIEADLETLSLNAAASGSILDREKNLFATRFIVEEARGIFAGPDSDHLDEYAQRENEPYESPVDLKTGLVSIRVDSYWEAGGRVLIRQTDPLPVSILQVMPDEDIGGAK